jgi:trehalose synthase
VKQLRQVDVAAMDPGGFVSVLSRGEYQTLLDLIDRAGVALRGRVIWNVNSTPAGGGVAELLRPLLGYCRGSDVDARWVVISAGADFFALTKRLHNPSPRGARRRRRARPGRALGLRAHAGRQRRGARAAR